MYCVPGIALGVQGRRGSLNSYDGLVAELGEIEGAAKVTAKYPTRVLSKRACVVEYTSPEGAGAIAALDLAEDRACLVMASGGPDIMRYFAEILRTLSLTSPQGQTALAVKTDPQEETMSEENKPMESKPVQNKPAGPSLGTQPSLFNKTWGYGFDLSDPSWAESRDSSSDDNREWVVTNEAVGEIRVRCESPCTLSYERLVQRVIEWDKAAQVTHPHVVEVAGRRAYVVEFESQGRVGAICGFEFGDEGLCTIAAAGTPQIRPHLLEALRTFQLDDSRARQAQKAAHRGKSKAVALVLAWFFGLFGAHNLYLGARRAAFLQIGLLLAFIPMWVVIGLLGFVLRHVSFHIRIQIWQIVASLGPGLAMLIWFADLIALLTMRRGKFDEKYNRRTPEPFEFAHRRPKKR